MPINNKLKLRLDVKIVKEPKKTTEATVKNSNKL